MIDPGQIKERRLVRMGKTELRLALEFYDKPENRRAFRKWQRQREKALRQKETAQDGCTSCAV